ncbi:hypothetical protein [Candidatus Harpocratesius sp.]
MEENMRLQFKMIVFATENGLPLVSVKIDKNLDEKFLTPFFSSIHQYSDRGGLETNETRILIKDLEIVVNRRNKIMLIGVFSEDLIKLPSIQENMYRMLELFEEMYKEELMAIDNGEAVDMSIFKKFEVLIEHQIQMYIDEVKNTENKPQLSIFGKLISIIKNHAKR